MARDFCTHPFGHSCIQSTHIDRDPSMNEVLVQFFIAETAVFNSLKESCMLARGLGGANSWLACFLCSGAYSETGRHEARAWVWKRDPVSHSG